MIIDSIRKRIFLNTAIIMALALIMIAYGIYEFNNSRKFTEKIFPYSQQMVELERFKKHFESFEHNLEDYFVIRSDTYKEEINRDFANLLESLKKLHPYEHQRSLILQIESKCLSQKQSISFLFSDEFQQISSRKKNEIIHKLFAENELINSFYRSLSEQVLANIQFLVAAQQNNIRVAVVIFVLIGGALLALYIFLGMRLSYRISVPILKLKSVTKEISKGNLTIEAQVESSDEIGELSRDFNKMTVQLQKSMDDLKASEEKFRSIAAKVPGMVYQMAFRPDGSYKFNYISPLATDVFGFPADLEEYKYTDHLHPDDKERFISSVIDAVTNTAEWRFIGRLLLSDEQIKWFRGLATPTKTDGDVVYNGIFLDITDLKNVEKELQLAHDDLEKKVVERTEALRQEIEERKQIQNNLQFAKKEAEAANQAKSEFLANISHELRNPMHQILSYSKYGTEKIDKPKAKLLHYFIQTKKAAERLMLLLNDLLDLSKMESGRMNYRFGPNNLYEIVVEVLSEMKPSAEEKHLSLNIINSEVPTEVYCDDYRIGQVVRNLISNAIKFTPESKQIQIKLEKHQLEDIGTNGASVQVTVSDQGVGIPEEELVTVFDKFTQSTKTKTGAGGTGLGLAICKEIIQAHHGEIWADNKPDEGTDIHFTLPYRENET